MEGGEADVAEVGVADGVVGQKMMTLMLKCKLPWVCAVNSL